MSSKKWTKKAVKDKVDYPTLFADENAYQDVLKAIRNSKTTTHTQICERLHISVALAKRVMRQLVESGDFSIVSKSSRAVIFKNNKLAGK
ncbi:Ribosomal protein S25 [Giardia muris]|uniref:40S ribosomal protein S25 n=1 Tax=Giardia muris TaxID=5742 RepID=A0A4Z1SYG7_GIAMU|nr:Ribosomal protein S25 [Giardia muris]|eukprot:TNJ29825.1 Ribosomal protein S25 [Giardia muris]